MKDKICDALGKNIKKYRKLRGLTQEKLAETVDIEIKSLSLIETGNNFVSSKTLQKLSTVLDVAPSDLLMYDNDNETDRLYKDAQQALELLKNNQTKLRILTYVLNGLL